MILNQLWDCPRVIGVNTHCGGPIQNWIRERVRGVSDHQERPKAFPMARMSRMIMISIYAVQGNRP